MGACMFINCTEWLLQLFLYLHFHIYNPYQGEVLHPQEKQLGASEEQLVSCMNPLAPWKVAPLRLHPSATNHFSKAECPDVLCSTAIKRNAIMSLYFKDVSIFLSTFLQIELCAEARGFEWSPDACVGLVGARGASDSGGKGQDGWRDA